MTGGSAVADVLGSPYTREEVPLPADAEGPVVATLVQRPPSGRAPDGGSRGAVLHVHGFCDYFFQRGYGDWWAARGYHVYAVDLRKYGRSLGDHQSPGFITDLAGYDAELDEAWRRITDRDGHRRVVLSGHSTGGLTLPLWADRKRVPAAGLVLNSPWFDLDGPAWVRTVGTRLVDRAGRHQPTRVVPRRTDGVYARSLHRDHDGEWEFDLAWKPVHSWPVRLGWLRAVRRGQARLHRGLTLPFPALVLSSDRSTTPGVVDEDAHTSDVVLDVTRMRRWAPALGGHVTLAPIAGARHDVTLSRAGPRGQVYAELARWLGAYVEEPAHDRPPRV